MTTATAIAYSLPSVVTVNGTFAVTVYSEYDFAVDGVVAPTIQTILEIGDLTEKASVAVGVSEIGNLTLSIRDDHSAAGTPEGFWFKVLQGECWIKLYLDGTYFFFGTVDKPTVAWEEHAIVSSTRIRTASLTVLAMSKKMFETSIEDWITQVIAKATFIDDPLLDEPSDVIKLTEMLACMLVASGLNTAYPGGATDDDIDLLYGTQAEIDFGEGIGHYRVDQIYLPVKYYSDLAPETRALCQYFNTAGVNCLARQSDGTGYYDSNELKRLISDLLSGFGLLMRMDYDVVTDRHLVKLMHRHDVYADAVDLTFGGREKASSISFSNPLIGDSIRASDLIDDTAFIWQSKLFSRFPNPTAPDGRIKFDVDMKCIFIVDPTPVSGLANHSVIIWSGVPTEAFAYATGVRYYSTVTGLMTEALSADPLKIQDAMSEYQYERFTQNFATIVRTYGRMEASDGSTTSHIHLTIMRRTKINTLGSDVYYFANSVTKKAMSAEVAIEWQQED